MPIAVSRALAVTAGASLLILLALGGQAQAAKSTKTVNAKSTLTSLVNQTKNLPRQAASQGREGEAPAPRASCALGRLEGALHARSSDLSAYRKTLRATKIIRLGQGQGRRARLAKRLAALGPASTRASRKLLSDRRTKSCGGGVVTPTLEDRQDDGAVSSDENGMKHRRRPAGRCSSSRSPRAASRGRSSCCRTPARRARPARPGIPVSSSTIAVPDGATLVGQARRRRSPTRSTTSRCSRSSPSPVDQARRRPDAEAELRRRRVLRPAVHVRRQGATGPTRSSPPRRRSARRSARRATSTSRGLHFPAAQYNPKTDKLAGAHARRRHRSRSRAARRRSPTRRARRGRPRRTGSSAAC